jgi:hypothetical protein
MRVAVGGLRVLLLSVLLMMSACVSNDALGRSSATATAPPSAYDFTLGSLDAPPGVYPDAAPSLCCFVGPSAAILLTRPANATTVNITFYQPVLPAHPAYQGTMIVSFGGHHPTSVAHLTSGLHTVSLPLPKEAMPKPTLEIGLRFPKAFVPANERMGTDTRRLSIVLRKINLTNESPPSAYDFTKGMLSGVPTGMFGDPSPTTCCFVGPEATLRLTRPPEAKTLVLTFYQPSLPAHPKRESSMIVTLNGEGSTTVSHLKSGYHVVSLSLPEHVRSAPILTVGLSFPNSFVPSQEKMGADTRHLSIVLRKAELR